LSAAGRRRAMSSAHVMAAEELFHQPHNREVRWHLWKAFRLCPKNLFQHRHVQLWAGCLLAPAAVRTLRRVKARLVGHAGTILAPFARKDADG
jgi:hypothetical protein